MIAVIRHLLLLNYFFSSDQTRLRRSTRGFISGIIIGQVSRGSRHSHRQETMQHRAVRPAWRGRQAATHPRRYAVSTERSALPTDTSLEQPEKESALRPAAGVHSCPYHLFHNLRRFRGRTDSADDLCLIARQHRSVLTPFLICSSHHCRLAGRCEDVAPALPTRSRLMNAL